MNECKCITRIYNAPPRPWIINSFVKRFSKTRNSRVQSDSPVARSALCNPVNQRLDFNAPQRAEKWVFNRLIDTISTCFLFVHLLLCCCCSVSCGALQPFFSKVPEVFSTVNRALFSLSLTMSLREYFNW